MIYFQPDRRPRGRGGFTIVELMMVIGIIGILMGIVTTAAATSVKQARARQAQALCVAVEAGLDTYYAQNEEWPGSIGSSIKNGSISAGSNTEGYNNSTDVNLYVLQPGEIRDMIAALVKETKKGNPMLDISGLYVSRNPGEANDKGYGMDFASAIRGTKKSKKKMKLSEMYFGYPETTHGWFRRFKITYSIPTDKMKVTRQ